MSSIKPTEAHRRHLVQGNEKKERTYPFAGDTDNDATYDPEEDAEEAPAAGPSVAKGLLAILRERGEQWTKSPSKKQVDLQLMVFFYPRRAENRTFRPPVTQKQKTV